MPSIKLYKISQTVEELTELASKYVALDALSSALPGGAYSSFRTYYVNRLFPMEVHYERLESSARLEGKRIVLPRRLISETISQLISESTTDLRLRLTLDLTNEVGDIYLSSELLKTPSAGDYKFGVKAITKQFLRENPKAKLTEFLSKAIDIRSGLDKSINEVIMRDENGRLKEGLSSNFFAVRDNVIYTADEDVLSGITRSIVLAEAKHAGIHIDFNAFRYQEMTSCQEAFITSASRSVLPVSEIDGQAVGTGEPGAITRLLSDRFWQYIQLHTSKLE